MGQRQSPYCLRLTKVVWDTAWLLTPAKSVKKSIFDFWNLRGNEKAI